MLSQRCLNRKQEGGVCPLVHCRFQRTQHIYGLYDARLHDIFYVGSTFYPSERFAQHLGGAKSPYNYKSMWIQNILESGSFPLPILLHEFQTMCDQYTRQVEREVAEQVRAEGHTALCDGYGGPLVVEVALWMEHIDRIAKQAQVNCTLREMFNYT